MINIDEYKSLCRNKSMILSQPLNLKNTLNKLNNDLCFKKNCFAKISNSTNKLLEQNKDVVNKSSAEISRLSSPMMSKILNKKTTNIDKNKEKIRLAYDSNSLIDKNLINLSQTKINNDFMQDKNENNMKKTYSVSPITGNVNQFYDRLNDMATRHRNRKKHGVTRQSFLSMKEDFIVKLIKSDNIRELFHLTSKEEEFLQSMKYSSEEKLISYCDSFNNIIRDYLNALRLIFRIKKFMKVSIKVNSAMRIEEATELIIKNACEILDCDRTTIFVHDKISKMLVAYIGHGMKIKVQADKGIVGTCFQTGDREKIDDAYLDARFNQDVDTKTGYKTKTILCVPLRDHDGEIFGVIQSINKKIGLFNADDEEIMEIFGTQSSILLSNSLFYDENSSFIYRIKLLIEFSISIQAIFNIGEFTVRVEKLMTLYWTTNQTKFLIIDNNEGKLYQYTIYNKSEVKNRIGIIGQVYSKKELIAVERAEDNGHYNCLVDIDTGGSIITFPIFDSKFEKVLAIAQSSYPFTLNKSTMKPRENDTLLISYFSNLTSVWLENFYSKNM